MPSTRRTCCSTRSTAAPRSALARTAASSRVTILGARPRDSSSASTTLGSAASTRPRASICCSPPDSSPALVASSGRSSGKAASAASTPPRPSRRLSRHDRPLNRARSSVISAMPCCTRRCIGAVVASPCSSTSPLSGLRSPARVSSAVVLPAPLAPSKATTSPGSTWRFRSCSTGTPRYPAESPRASRAAAAVTGSPPGTRPRVRRRPVRRPVRRRAPPRGRGRRRSRPGRRAPRPGCRRR